MQAEQIAHDEREFCPAIIEHQTACVQFIVDVRAWIGQKATHNLTAQVCQDLKVDASFPTAVATSMANVAAIAWKDKEYAKLQNAKAVDFPRVSYGLFALRDGLTIVSSFNIKRWAARRLEAESGMSRNNADLVASFTVLFRFAK